MAPQQINERTGILESKELHHNPAQRHGGMYDIVPVWPDEHENLDKYRHTGK